MENELEIIEALKGALSYSEGEFTLETILAELVTGESILIQVDGLCAVLKINHYETYKSCCVQLCGGKLNSTNLAEGLEVIKSFAAANQCSDIEVYGRQGWAKLLSDLGFYKAYVVMKLNLEVV